MLSCCHCCRDEEAPATAVIEASEEAEILNETKFQFDLWTVEQLSDFFLSHFEDIDGYCFSPTEETLRQQLNKNFIYGEISPQSVQDIVQKFQLTHHDVALDLGSGTGKFVIQIALQFGIKAYGFELSDPRHELALSVYNEYIPVAAKPLIWLVKRDILLDTYPEDTTFFFFNCIMFSQEDKKVISRKIEDLVMKANRTLYCWSIGAKPLDFDIRLVQRRQKFKSIGSWNKEEDETVQSFLYWLSSEHIQAEHEEQEFKEFIFNQHQSQTNSCTII